TNISMTRDTLGTLAGVLQSHWWNGALVSTLGWREDRVKRYTSSPFTRRVDQTLIFDPENLDTDTPADAATEDTLTYSGVLRVDKILGRRMPDGVDLDLHYAWSENFQGLAGPRSVHGGFYDAPSGETRELGFSMSLLDDKLFFRANWFETEQQNMTDSDITQPISTVVSLLSSGIYRMNTAAV